MRASVVHCRVAIAEDQPREGVTSWKPVFRAPLLPWSCGRRVPDEREEMRR